MPNNVIVLTSTVADGSMYNRHNHNDASVIANREAFLENHGIHIDQTTRLHINAYVRDKEEHETNWLRYHEVTDAEKGLGMKDGNIFISDALITKDPNHALFLPVADCVGAVFYDPNQKVLMVAHLGRHSLEQQGGLKAIEYLAEKYNCDPKNLLVWLTPSPSKELYPIWTLDNKGMKEVTLEQLHSAGILSSHITDNPIETDKDENYFSYSEFLKGHRSEDGDHMIVAMMTN